MRKNKNLKLSPDQIGALSSFLCLIHCFSTPFLVVGLAHTTHSHILGFEFIFLLVSLWAMTQALKSSRTILLSFGFVGSYLLLLLGFILSHYWESLINIMHTASVLLIFLHYINFKTCRPAKMV
jgi:hypothetical protein